MKNAVDGTMTRGMGGKHPEWRMPCAGMAFLCLCVLALPAWGQTYSPIAQWGGLGAGAGQFNKPYGVATDGSGNVYVVDTDNHRVQKFTSTGAFLAQWGTYGEDGDGEFRWPQCVAVDPSGNVYVSDTFNNRVQKFTSTGVFITKWGVPGAGEGQFNYPYGIAADGTGNVYVADGNNHRIQKFTSEGVFVAQWGGSGSGDGQFNIPYGVALDGAGNLYVSDFYNHRVQKFSAAGAYLAQWGGQGYLDGLFSMPAGVAVDTSGNVYACDLNNNRVQKFSGAGAYLTQWGGPGSDPGQFNDPQGVAVDTSGNVYVTDRLNHRVQKFALRYAVTVTSTAPESTGTALIPVTVTFDAAVTGFDASDLVVSNATVTNFTGNGATYTFDLVPLATGSVTVDIADGAAVGAGSVASAPATGFTRTYTGTGMPLAVWPVAPALLWVGVLWLRRSRKAPANGQPAPN